MIFDLLNRKYCNLFYDTRFSEILTGSAWALCARVIATGLGFVFSIFVARLYGAEIVGIVAVINSFLILATTFTVMGTQTSILRLIPEHLAKYSATSAFKIYRKTQYLVITSSIIMGFIFFFADDIIANKIFLKPKLSIYIGVVSFFIIFRSIMLLVSQAIRGFRMIKIYALMQFIPQLINLVFLILISLLCPCQGTPIYAILSGPFMTSIIGCYIMEIIFKKRMHPTDNVHFTSSRDILAISLPMLMTSTMTFLISQAGVIMLGMFRAESEVGYYAIATKMAMLTTFIFSAVTSMAGPKFSELFYGNKMGELFQVARKAAKLIFFTSTPILLCLLIFGKAILSIVFGNDFAIAYSALVFLVIGQFFNAISGSAGIFMNMTGNQNALKNIMLITACLNLILNCCLIPYYGIKGAAIAVMISLILWNIITVVYIKRKYGKIICYFPAVFS